jgi:hypothetical protein
MIIDLEFSKILDNSSLQSVENYDSRVILGIAYISNVDKAQSHTQSNFFEIVSNMNLLKNLIKCRNYYI